MKRRLLVLAGAGALGAGLLAGPLSAAPPGAGPSNPQNHDADCASQNAPTLSVHYTGPDTMWPPNHKYQPFSVTGTDSTGAPVKLTTTGTHDQYDSAGTEYNGAGSTTQDIIPNDSNATEASSSTATAPAAEENGTGSVTTDWEARSERSGHFQAGRTYTITGTLTNNVESCTGTFTIVVPHDQGASAPKA